MKTKLSHKTRRMLVAEIYSPSLLASGKLDRETLEIEVEETPNAVMLGGMDEMGDESR